MSFDGANRRNISAIAATVERRRALARGRAARPRGRRHVLLFGAHDRRVLPARPARRAARGARTCAFHATAPTPSGRASGRASAAARTRPSLAERQAAAVAEGLPADREAEELPSLDDARASAPGMSRFHFHRVFKAVTGVTPKAYAAAHRAQARARGARREATRVTEAIYDAGFNSNGRFYADVDRAARHDADASSAPAAADTDDPLRGRRVLARRDPGRARRDKGVCAILLGDDPDALVREPAGPLSRRPG